MGSKATTTNFLFFPSFNIFFVYRTLSMRQKTQNHRNQGSIDKKFDFFAVPTSHTQMGSLSAKNAIEKFSSLGTFKIMIFILDNDLPFKNDLFMQWSPSGMDLYIRQFFQAVIFLLLEQWSSFHAIISLEGNVSSLCYELQYLSYAMISLSGTTLSTTFKTSWRKNLEGHQRVPSVKFHSV